MADYERVLCVKNEVFVFKIPPRTTNRGYRAADWNLENPDWTGRLRIVAQQKQCCIKLEDRNTGELFANAPIEEYPGIAVEQVLDSSRYFVIQIKDPSGRKAFIGIGFADRGDSFDLNVALQDHFKWIKREEDEAINATKIANDPGPKLDLGFKQGQTIKININSKKQVEEKKSRPRGGGATGGGGQAAPPSHWTKKQGDEEGGAKSRPRGGGATGGGGLGLLPPPPGAKLPPPPTASGLPPPQQAPQQVRTQQPQAPSAPSSHIDLLGDLSAPAPSSTAPPAQQKQANSDPWGDFIGSSSGANSGSSSDWVNFS